MMITQVDVMPGSTQPLCNARRQRTGRLLGGWLLGVGALLAVSLAAPEASASEPRTSDLGSTVFGTPRLSWNAGPRVRLQPEAGRISLELPVEWMPPPDFGFLGLPLDPNKHWDFHNASRWTRASLGTGLRVQINDPRRSVDFGLSVVPRAAVAVLRFDPIAWTR